MNRLFTQWCDLTLALTVVAGLGIILTVAGFLADPERDENRDLVYEQTGEFDYSAPVNEPSLYDGGAVATGDPIFFAQSSQVAVSYRHRVEAGHAVAAAGQGRLIAEVGEASGWKRTLVLAPETPFTGAGTTLSGSLDLARVQELMAQFAAATGVQHPSFTVSLVSEVTVNGSLAGAKLATSATPRLTFRADPAGLRIERPNTPDAGDPLNPVSSGMVRATSRTNHTLALGPLEASVATVRLAGLALVAVAVILSAALAAAALRLGSEKDPAQVFAAAGVPVVPVADAAAERGALTTVDVARIEDLATIALREGGPVLDAQAGGGRRFTVYSQGIAYQWSATPERGQLKAQRTVA
ncbi:MAG: hypothetical protein ACKVVT_07755 [Dehalococcoidia bacterium]